MFPDNIVQACSQQISTVYKRVKITKVTFNNITNLNETIKVEEIIKELKYIDGTNVMGK
jgi:hypothetical protein